VPNRSDVSEPMLKVEDLNVSYGNHRPSSMCRWKYPPVCRRCARANGAGKSTLAGGVRLVPSTSGRIMFDGVDVTKWRLTN